MPSNATEYAKMYYEKNREKIKERGKKELFVNVVVLKFAEMQN